MSIDKTGSKSFKYGTAPYPVRGTTIFPRVPYVKRYKCCCGKYLQFHVSRILGRFFQNKVALKATSPLAEKQNDNLKMS